VKWDGNVPDDKQLAMSANHGVLVVIENKYLSRKLSETWI